MVVSPDESWAGGPLTPPVRLWGKWGCHTILWLLSFPLSIPQQHTRSSTKHTTTPTKLPQKISFTLSAPPFSISQQHTLAYTKNTPFPSFGHSHTLTQKKNHSQLSVSFSLSLSQFYTLHAQDKKTKKRRNCCWSHHLPENSHKIFQINLFHSNSKAFKLVKVLFWFSLT